MKKANYIISHLKNRPYLKKLQHVECFNMLLSLLPKNISENTRFMYQKNDTLFFVLTHPGIKMEFNYKSNLIKSILKKLIELNPQCIFMNSNNIKAFVTNKITIKEQLNSKKNKQRYKERSNASFENRSEDQELKELFEEIRKTIKETKQQE